MASLLTALILPLALLLLRELETPGGGGGGAGMGWGGGGGGQRGAPGSASLPVPRRCHHGPRVALVPDVADDEGGQTGREGGAAMRVAAVRHGIRVLLAPPDTRGRPQTQLPNVPLRPTAQASRGTGPQTHFRIQGHQLQIPAHPEQLPPGGPRLLLLLGLEQLDPVLQ